MSELYKDEFIDDIESQHSKQDPEEDFEDDIESTNSKTDKDEEKEISESESMVRVGEFYVPLGTRTIGKGGQALVYPCRKDGETGLNYVVKIYLPETKHIDKIRDLENKVAKIKSDNLVNNIFCGDTDDGRFAVVMPRYERIDRRSNSINFSAHGNEADYINKFIKAVHDINEGMKSFHNKEIIHSDIKPGNLMISHDLFGNSNIVFIDLGGGINADEKRHEASMQSGDGNAYTEGYVAPECQRGRKVKGSVYSDMYSAGVSLAEYLVGFYPNASDLQAEHSDPEKIDYYNANSGEGEKRAGRFLLPKSIPDFIYRFFQGTLYIIPEDKDTAEDRWGHEKVDYWLALMGEGRYAEAANIEIGPSAPKAETVAAATGTKERDENLKTPIPFLDSVEIVYSPAEMVDQFLKKNRMKEVITKIKTNDKDFFSSFQRLDPTIPTVMKAANQKMQNKSALDMEKIFISDIVNIYGSEDAKNKLIRGGMVFDNKRALGERMYSALSTAMDKGTYKNLKKSAEIAKMNNPDAFTKLLQLFERNYLSGFFNSKKTGWTIDRENMDRIKRWEARINSDHPNEWKNKGEDLAELFRLAFYLQEMPVLKIENLQPFSDAESLTDYINELGKKNPESAIEFYSKLHTADDTKLSYKPQVYAWMMDAEGFKKRPGEEMKPGSDWENWAQNS